MQNNSGLFPRGRAVLVKPYEAAKVSSIIALPDSVKEQTMLMEQRAVIVEVGAAAWHDEPEQRAKVGEHVLISRYAGHFAVGPLDKEQYRFVNDRDIFAVITPE